MVRSDRVDLCPISVVVGGGLAAPSETGRKGGETASLQWYPLASLVVCNGQQLTSVKLIILFEPIVHVLSLSQIYDPNPMSSHVNKLTTEKNKRALLELVNLPGNGEPTSYSFASAFGVLTNNPSADACADCKARYPRWASHNLGIFIWYVVVSLSYCSCTESMRKA